MSLRPGVAAQVPQLRDTQADCCSQALEAVTPCGSQCLVGYVGGEKPGRGHVPAASVALCVQHTPTHCMPTHISLTQHTYIHNKHQYENTHRHTLHISTHTIHTYYTNITQTAIPTHTPHTTHTPHINIEHTPHIHTVQYASYMLWILYMYSILHTIYAA